MDKKIILAVAGAGKSTYIVNKIEDTSKALIITYTELNAKLLKEKIIKKLGYIPKNVRVYTYFSFVYSFCLKPLLGHQINIRGINFENNFDRYVKKTHLRFWFDKHNRVYANRISRLIIDVGILEEVLKKIDKYFDFVCIDEFQDFAGNDFDFMCKLTRLHSEVILVGDFYQHTFDTSRDGIINKNLHSDYDKYCQRLLKSGFQIDKDLLSNSYRCSQSVCDFVSTKLRILIGSHNNKKVIVSLVEDADKIIEIFENSMVVKLFYQDSSKFRGNTQNWGNVKGADSYNDVCVILNKKSFEYFKRNNLNSLVESTKNKLYVACTRARGNLYFIEEKKLKELIKTY